MLTKPPPVVAWLLALFQPRSAEASAARAAHVAVQRDVRQHGKGCEPNADGSRGPTKRGTDGDSTSE